MTFRFLILVCLMGVSMSPGAFISDHYSNVAEKGVNSLDEARENIFCRFIFEENDKSSN